MPARPSAVVVGTACYLFSGVFWGLNIPLTAELLRDFDPFWLSACRYAIAATLLGALVLLTLGPRQLRAPIPPARIATMSLFVSGFLVTYNVGLMLVHPITAAALLAGSPVYVAVVSRAMTGAPLARGFWPATALTVLGAGVAVWGRASAAGTGLHVGGGEVLIVASIVCWTVYSILAQRWFAPDVPQLRRTWLTALGSLPWLVAFWAIARATGAIGEPNLRPPAAALANLAITAVFSTALASVAWNLGVARLGIAAGGMWQNTVPVFAVLFSLAFFGVVPTAAQVAGGAIVLAGVLLMQWNTIRAARRPASAA
jgi:drug/metabolite transporter (DMT)-like permease